MKIEVDMLNATKNDLADVLSVSPSSELMYRYIDQNKTKYFSLNDSFQDTYILWFCFYIPCLTRKKRIVKMI